MREMLNLIITRLKGKKDNTENGHWSSNPQFSSIDCCCRWVAKSCSALCDHMDYSKPGFSVLHYLPVFAQINFHWVGDAIQPSHPLLSPSPPALSLSQPQGLFL